MTTLQKGELAQLRVQLRAAELGFMVSKPCFEGARYDLVLDDGTRLYRVQVKYCDSKGRPGSYTIDLKKHTGGYNRRLYTYSEEEIDAIVVYFPRLDALVWLPPALWHTRSALTLRAEPPRNGQQRSVNFLRDYLW